MATSSAQSSAAWALAAAQEGVIAGDQLVDLGLTVSAIRHRVSTGRLHRLWPGVYAVGRRQVARSGLWRAAVFACGPGSVLSHPSGAALWGMRPDDPSSIHVSVPAGTSRRLAGIRCHRRSNLDPSEIVERDGIAVTCVATTLVDIACDLSTAALERAVNDADKADLIDPEALRAALGRMPPRPGLAILRNLLDRLTFVLTDSELERRFLPVARRAGVSTPITGAWVTGVKVDFYWPDLGLVVETDGLRYHRTPAQQARDRLRDQAHVAAGLTPLRFTHGQVRFEPQHVEATLMAVANRLRAGSRQSDHQ